jgi:hypothetical protein
LIIGIPTFITDSVMYGHATFAALNIAAYNVIGPHVWDKKGSGGVAEQQTVGTSMAAETGGSHLYGTEPWWFYIANCTINHNIAFVFFMCMPVCAFLRKICTNRHMATSSRFEKSSASSEKSRHSLVDAKLQMERSPASSALVLGMSPSYLWIAFCECFLLSLQVRRHEFELLGT